MHRFHFLLKLPLSSAISLDHSLTGSSSRGRFCSELQRFEGFILGSISIDGLLLCTVNFGSAVMLFLIFIHAHGHCLRPRCRFIPFRCEFSLFLFPSLTCFPKFARYSFLFDLAS